MHWPEVWTTKRKEIKSLRWSNNYFRGRLNSTSDCERGKLKWTSSWATARFQCVGFKGSNAIAVKEGRKWLDRNGRSRKFAEILREHGGYLDASDFAFVVHRLLYLPESRRLIAWDNRRADSPANASKPRHRQLSETSRTTRTVKGFSTARNAISVCAEQRK